MTSEKVKSGAGTVVETHTRTFDELGRLLASIGAASQAWTHAYDKVGNLKTVTDPRQNIFAYAYDGLDRLIKLTDEQGDETTLTRTAAGEIATHADPGLVTTAYVRNGWGEVILETSPDIGTIEYARDQRGLVTQKTDGRGIVSRYAYDDAGRLTATTYPGSPAENVAYFYDGTTNGNLGRGQLTGVVDQSGSTAYFYDMREGVARVTQTIGAQTYTIGYDTDAAGRPSDIVYPSGRQVGIWRFESGNPASIGTKRQASDPWTDLGLHLSVHPYSEILKEITHANGVSEWRTMTGDGRIDVYGVTRGSVDLLHRVLGYVDGINLNQVWDQLDSSKEEAYWYGAANRLQNTQGPWGELNFYTDGTGNRTFREHTADGVTTEDIYDYVSGSNRLEGVATTGQPYRAFTHDGAGNMLTSTKGGLTTAFAYNHAGRLAQVTIDGSVRGPYVYNAFGQLASRQVSGEDPATTIHMIYDRDGNLIAEADAATGITKREYIWLGSRPVAVVDNVDTTPVLYHVHVDHLDRPVMMTNAAGAVAWRATYLPFGEVHEISGPASLNARFPGQWFMAETGLSYNWHRWYAANLGRYTQPDPLGMPDGPNRFVYALNSPLMYTDPTGESATGLVGGIIGVDISVPDPSDAAWPKWAAYGIAVAGAAVYDMCVKDRKDQCDDNYNNIDIPMCRALGRIDKRRAAKCYASAAARLAACYRGEPPPPLDSYNN